MNFNDLSKFVWRKYGLKFEPALPGSQEIYVLRSPFNGAYFAIMSRILKSNLGLKGPGHLSVLDLKCGLFSATIKDLPGFSTAYRVQSSDWVGVQLKGKNKAAISNALDYAFKLAMNKEHTPIMNQQYITVPADKVEAKYQAQPIKPRRQKARPRPKMPPVLAKMRAAYDYSILPIKGRAKNFYQQGQIAAGYEDDYQADLPNAAAFARYYPTYHDMTLVQLRTYFTWRTKLRHGHYLKTSLSYAYVYVYELLNNIGFTDPALAWQKLNAFIKHYAQKFAPAMMLYLRPWRQDYVLYYHLGGKELQTAFASEIKQDQLYHVLLQADRYGAAQIWAALTALSPYLRKCLSVRKKGPQFQELTAHVWRTIMALKKKQGISFFHRYVARRNLLGQRLFKGAVFYWRRQQFTPCRIDAERRYFYQNGHWYLSCLVANPREKQALNTLGHEIDRLARQYFHLGHPLKARKLESIYLQAIAQGIKDYQQAQEQAKIQKVTINFQDLGQIRADASATRESLLTDEEKKEEKELEKQEAKPAPLKVAQNTPASETEDKEGQEQESSAALTLLSQDEAFFLQALLQKTPYRSYLKQHHLMASILADQINQKLFDDIGDNVIEFNAQNQPQVVSDYQAELAAQFLKKKGS